MKFDIDSYREILDTITRNKSRSFLTGFGVFWGVFMLIVLIGGGQGLKEMLQSNFAGFATNTAMIWTQNTTKPYKGFRKGRYVSMVENDMTRLRQQVPELDIITPYMFGGNKKAVAGEYSFDATVAGVDHDYARVAPPMMYYGRYINEMDVRQARKVCVIGKEVYKRLFPGGGDPCGKRIRVDAAYYTVVGVDYKVNGINISGRPDQLQLNAVPAQEAKSDFDMGSDGVKWMASQNAQIYASRNGGRYSLLSAISIDAEQSIGVSLPETGEYTISIPEDCDASEYETVWLKDKETGKAVDLKEGSYLFYATQTGEMNNRFNISFNRKETDINSDITIIPSGNYHILIKGLKQNDLIRIYGTSGVLALQKQAKSDTEQLRSPVNGTVAVEVTRGGKQIAVKKIALK